MQRELTRLDGEITKHSQFEKSQVEKLEARLKREATTTSKAAGSAALCIETRELEATRESNKATLVNRRKEIRDLIRATELFSSQEHKDFAIVTEILAVSQATGAALGDAQAKTLQLIEKYDAAFQQIENTREAAKTINTQFETNPGASTTKDNMTGLMKTLKAHTQVLEDILTTSRQYIGDFRGFSETVNQQVTQGGLPTNIPYNDTSFENTLRRTGRERQKQSGP